MGTRKPCFSNPSTMAGMALAASSLLTVTLTTSLPARAKAATCLMVPGMSAVSVLVIDCTMIGALLPTRTAPMVAVEVFLRRVSAMIKALFYHSSRPSQLEDYWAEAQRFALRSEGWIDPSFFPLITNWLQICRKAAIELYPLDLK